MTRSAASPPRTGWFFNLANLHYVARSLSRERLRYQTETGRARDRGTQRLVGCDLDQLLELLELGRYQLQELVKLHELLLLKNVQLLQLLRHDLQELQNLLERLCRADPESRD